MKDLSFILFALMVCIAFSKTREKCSLNRHVKNNNWKFERMENFKGETIHERPLPVVDRFINETAEEINMQINRELFAHYTYLSMAAHFQRDDYFLPGFHKFFKKQSEEEHKHAQMLIEYLHKRGGRLKLHHIRKPCKDVWGSGLQAMTDALHLEKDIYAALLGLHSKSNGDPQFEDFIESNFLGEQVDSIKQLSNYVNTLKRLEENPLGEYLFDKHTLGGDIDNKGLH